MDGETYGDGLDVSYCHWTVVESPTWPSFGIRGSHNHGRNEDKEKKLLPWIDKARVQAIDFLRRIRLRGCQLPLEETSEFEKRLIIANREFLHYHLDYVSLKEYVKVDARFESVAPLRMVPPKDWNLSEIKTLQDHSYIAKEEKTPKQPQASSGSFVSTRLSAGHDDFGWKPSNMKSVDQVKQSEIIEPKTAQTDPDPPKKESNPTHCRFRFNEVESFRPGEKAPIWAKESRRLAANFLAEMRSHGGRFLSDAATSFQRRLVKANDSLLRYSTDKFQGKTFICARSGLKVDQLKLVAPDASVLPEIVDFTGSKPDEVIEKKQEDLKKLEVEEKLEKKEEMKEPETTCKQAGKLNMKKELPAKNGKLGSPIRFEPSTVVEQMKIRAIEKDLSKQATTSSSRRPIFKDSDESVRSGVMSVRAKKLTFTSDDEDKVLEVEKPFDSTFETEDEGSSSLANELQEEPFLVTLQDCEDLRSIRVSVLQGIPFKIGIVLQGVIYNPESLDRVKRLLNYLAKSKTVLPAVGLATENGKSVVDMLITKRDGRAVYLTDYLIEEGSACRVGQLSGKRPSIQELYEFAQREKKNLRIVDFA